MTSLTALDTGFRHRLPGYPQFVHRRGRPPPNVEMIISPQRPIALILKVTQVSAMRAPKGHGIAVPA